MVKPLEQYLLLGTNVVIHERLAHRKSLVSTLNEILLAPQAKPEVGPGRSAATAALWDCASPAWQHAHGGLCQADLRPCLKGQPDSPQTRCPWCRPSPPRTRARVSRRCWLSGPKCTGTNLWKQFLSELGMSRKHHTPRDGEEGGRAVGGGSVGHRGAARGGRGSPTTSVSPGRAPELVPSVSLPGLGCPLHPRTS